MRISRELSEQGALMAAEIELEIDRTLAPRGLIFEHSGLALGYWRMVGAKPMDVAHEHYCDKLRKLKGGFLALIHAGKVVSYSAAPPPFPQPHGGDALRICSGSLLIYHADREPNVAGKSSPFNRPWDWTMGISRSQIPLAEVQQVAVDLRCDAFIWDSRLYLTLSMKPIDIDESVKRTYTVPPPVIA